MGGGTGSQDTGPLRLRTHGGKNWAGPPVREPPLGTPHLTVSELQILAFIVQVVGLQMQEKFISEGKKYERYNSLNRSHL